MPSYIYMMSDHGYLLGTKIGYDSSTGCKTSWNAAPSYSPRGIRFHGAWLVNPSGKELRDLEQVLQRHCGSLIASDPAYPYTGRDWVLVEPELAYDRITNFFAQHPVFLAQTGTRPILQLDHHSGRPVNDDYRNPRPSNIPRNPSKVVTFVYEESHTGRFKTQIMDEWDTPLKDTHRRYSRNGFYPVAAFTYREPLSPRGNSSVLESWKKVVTTFGFGPDPIHHGWLRENVTLAEIMDIYAENLTSFALRPSTTPLHVFPRKGRADAIKAAGL